MSWLTTVWPLKEKACPITEIKINFPELIIIDGLVISKKMRELVKMWLSKNWVLNRDFMINKFTERFQEWSEHEWTIYWIAQRLNIAVASDLLWEYKLYLEEGMSTLLTETYKLTIYSNSRDKSILLLTYASHIEKLIKKAIEEEIKKAKEAFWIKESYNAKSLIESLRFRLQKCFN